MVAIVFSILLVVVVLIAIYLNFKTEINPNHAFIIELINRFLK
jgi:hypothetical protein